MKLNEVHIETFMNIGPSKAFISNKEELESAYYQNVLRNNGLQSGLIVTPGGRYIGMFVSTIKYNDLDIADLTTGPSMWAKGNRDLIFLSAKVYTENYDIKYGEKVGYYHLTAPFLYFNEVKNRVALLIEFMFIYRGEICFVRHSYFHIYENIIHSSWIRNESERAKFKSKWNKKYVWDRCSKAEKEAILMKIFYRNFQ